MRGLRLKQPSVLPGFGLTLSFTLSYLGLIVLIPLGALVLSATGAGAEAWRSLASPRVLAAFRVSFGTAFAAAVVNAVFGLIVAWVMVRYTFPGRRIVDSLIDLPFALPTAIAFPAHPAGSADARAESRSGMAIETRATRARG